MFKNLFFLVGKVLNFADLPAIAIVMGKRNAHKLACPGHCLGIDRHESIEILKCYQNEMLCCFTLFVSGPILWRRIYMTDETKRLKHLRKPIISIMIRMGLSSSVPITDLLTLKISLQDNLSTFRLFRMVASESVSFYDYMTINANNWLSFFQWINRFL